MRVNIAALLFTAALTAAGIWLAVSLAEMQAAQDCVLTGRHNCAAIPMPQADAAPSRVRFANPVSDQP